MTHLEELIRSECPNGVQYYAFPEVCVSHIIRRKKCPTAKLIVIKYFGQII